tara:strand:- start:540 stop:1004 length:465 start_codon:yes stop_codon:yes gene_type:complete
MKNVMLAVLLMAASLTAQITTIQSDCVTITNNVPRLFEYDEFLYLGQPFTTEVFTDPNTVFIVSMGLPYGPPLCDLGPITGYAPWGTNTCFLVAWDVYTGVGVTANDGRALWTVPGPTCPQLVGTSIWFQAFVGCNGCPSGVAPTNGLSVDVQQ